MSKKKNISSRVPNGTRLQTRDDYLKDGINTKASRGNYRPVVVIDSNKKDELAVIKVTHSSKRKKINGFDGNSGIRLYIHIEDDEGNPIKVGRKFIKKGAGIGKKEANKIKKKAIKRAHPKIKKDNREKLRKLKGRA